MCPRAVFMLLGAHLCPLGVMTYDLHRLLEVKLS
jgi:hypothetical protein